MPIELFKGVPSPFWIVEGSGGYLEFIAWPGIPLRMQNVFLKTSFGIVNSGSFLNQKYLLLGGSQRHACVPENLGASEQVVHFV